jgi:hypothetical protein
MISVCVLPTLTIVNLELADWLGTLSTVLPTFVLATVAIVICTVVPACTLAC